MNILYALIAAIVIIGLVALGFFLRKQAQTLKAKAQLNDEEKVTVIICRWGKWGSWLVSAVGVVILVNNYVVRIPNPFELPSASISESPSEKPARPTGPLAVPPTNADPDAAAELERRLLEKARIQQQEDLNKK